MNDPAGVTNGVCMPEIPQLGDTWACEGGGGGRGRDPRINPDGTYNFEEKFIRATGRREWVMEEKRLKLVFRDAKTYSSVLKYRNLIA